MTQKPAKPATEAKHSAAATAAEPTKPATRAKRATPASAVEPTKPVSGGKRATSASVPESTRRVTRAKRAAAAAAEPTRLAPDRRTPSHDEISARAYFIALEEAEGDEVANWLRAERELATA